VQDLDHDGAEYRRQDDSGQQVHFYDQADANRHGAEAQMLLSTVFISSDKCLPMTQPM